MSTEIGILHDWLEEKYRILGLELSAKDTLARCEWQPIDDMKADLFDRDIGSWIRFSLLNREDKVSEMVQADVRWALDAVSKLEIRSGVAEHAIDPEGGWQVHVVWIVKPSCKAAWEKSIRDLRNRSAHPEEIGLDIIDASEIPLAQALKDKGVPSLIFEVRNLLRKDSNEMPRWLSPDSLFEEQLRALPDTVLDPAQRRFTVDFVERALSPAPEVQVPPGPSAVATPGKLAIANFRNIIDAEIDLSDAQGVTVIHGPNGSGKSSLFEAVCLALFGSSNRHLDLLADKDVSSAVRGDYVSNVLTRYGSSLGVTASLSIDGRDVLGALATSSDQAKQWMDAGRGTALAQEHARQFVEMSAGELAALVLGDYSPRARQVQAQVDESAASTKRDWQDWLRSIGLNASITKPETILRKVVQQTIGSQCPPESQSVFDWLRALGERFVSYRERAAKIQMRWEYLDSASGREAVAERISTTIEKSGSTGSVLEEWLSERARVSTEIASFVEETQGFLEPIRIQWPSLKDELKQISDWLQRPVLESGVSGVDESSSKDEDRSAQQSAVQSEMSRLAPIGQNLRARKEHLDSLLKGFLPKWHTDHPHTCPTCETVHATDIESVVVSVAKAVDQEYTQLRTDYAALQASLKALQAESGAAGKSPVSEDRMNELSIAFQLPRSGPESLEAILASSNSANEFVTSIERLLVTQIVKPALDVDASKLLANDVASSIIATRIEGQAKQERPLRWDVLKRSVDATALEIVSGHLPRTIETVWQEIALALAPSRWNQAATPSLSMELKRGSERLGVIVSNSDVAIPARHVLNLAEQHVLGLAWFFTRHLTHGRFISNFVVIDDPAHEMDQVTYRKFVRFLQAFLRAYKSLGRPLGLLIFLHQEERALELARAISTDGALTLLEWSRDVRWKGPDSTVRRVQLRNAEQHASLPPGLVGKRAELQQT